MIQMEKTYFLLLVISSFYSTFNCVDGQLSCTTSEGQNVNCIILPQCKHGMDIIQKNGIMSRQAQMYLRSNQCGFEGRDPMVCCSQGNTSAGDRNDPQQLNPTQRPNNNWNNNWNQQTTLRPNPNPSWNQQTTLRPNQGWNQQTTPRPNQGWNPQITTSRPNSNKDWNNNWQNNWGSQTTTTTTTRRPQYVNPLMLLPFDCGLDESNRIIGGEVTALGEFPWVAVLEYRQDGQVQTTLACGGTLISKRYVLTAAHCIRNAPSYLHLTNVRLGEHDVRYDPDCVSEGNGRDTCADKMLPVPIEREIVHESYNTPQVYRNDIALLRLAYDVTFTKYVKPICLPTFSGTSQSYSSAGWGAIENRRSSFTKLKVSLPYVDPYQCALKYSTKRVVLGAGQMCAGGVAGKDTCKGDSGGPLMKQIPATSGPNRWVIDGVLSLGHMPCGLDGWPGVYTKVHDYVRWIVSKLEP